MAIKELSSVHSGIDVNVTVKLETTVSEIYNHIVENYESIAGVKANPMPKVFLVNGKVTSSHVNIGTFKPSSTNPAVINGGCRTKLGSALTFLFPEKQKSPRKTSNRRLSPKVKVYLAENVNYDFTFFVNLGTSQKLDYADYNVLLVHDELEIVSTFDANLYNRGGRFLKSLFGDYAGFYGMMTKAVEVNELGQSVDITYSYNDITVSADNIEKAIIDIKSQLSKVIKNLEKLSASFAAPIKVALENVSHETVIVNGDSEFTPKLAGWLNDNKPKIEDITTVEATV